MEGSEVNSQQIIEEAIIPKCNKQYLEADFWEQRYAQYIDNNSTNAGERQKSQQTQQGSNNLPIREWLGNYSGAFADLFRKYVDKSASILILGCGNSLLGEELYDDGYQNVHSIDISESVIKLMSNHCEKCARLKWSTMDCRELTFADNQFDVVIEKATIEVFFVGESDPWSVSSETLTNVQQMANEITRVLKPSTGQFFSVSFTAPHFRKDLFHKMFIDGRMPPERMNIINVHQLGDHFHYYLYHLSKNPECIPATIFSYEPPKVTLVEDSDPAPEPNNCDIFLYSISL